MPERPAAWLATVARNAATSAIRHEQLARDKHDTLAREAALLADPIDDADIPDERLRLIFTCCHPALAQEARVALALQTLCGVSTSAIARLFLISEATAAQRLVRAKRKIRDANVPFEVPDEEAIDDRLDAVLSVLYLMFTDGYASSEGDAVLREEICEEAIRLARVVTSLVPRHAEARGLLALMLLHHARRAARVDDGGEIVEIEAQNRAMWDRAMIEEGTRALDEALALGAPAKYQIQAAIAALHATAASAPETDYAQIDALYATLMDRAPSPAVAIAHAIARGSADGPLAGLALLERYGHDNVLTGSDRVAAARADLLRRAGRTTEARAAYDEAIANARTDRERRFLERRRNALS